MENSKSLNESEFSEISKYTIQSILSLHDKNIFLINFSPK